MTQPLFLKFHIVWIENTRLIFVFVLRNSTICSPKFWTLYLTPTHVYVCTVSYITKINVRYVTSSYVLQDLLHVFYQAEDDTKHVYLLVYSSFRNDLSEIVRKKCLNLFTVPSVVSMWFFPDKSATNWGSKTSHKGLHGISIRKLFLWKISFMQRSTQNWTNVASFTANETNFSACWPTLGTAE